MLDRFRTFLRPLRHLWAGLLVLLLVMVAAGPMRLLESTELAAYDGWFQLRNEQPADSRIVIVGIDDLSLKQVGRWPWDRAVFADLLDRLSGAKVVAFDILWSEAATKAGDDQRLADAIARQGRVVLSAQVRTDMVKGQVNQSLQRPLSPLLEAAKSAGRTVPSLGIVNTPTGEDAVVRAAIPVDTDTTGSPVPSLALAAVMRFKGLTTDQIQVRPFGPVRVGDVTIRRDVQGQTYLNFAGGAATFPTYSAANVLKGKVDPAVFKDKIVLVGATEPSLKDEFAVPFAKDSTAGALMPGVEIQANAVATYLNGTDVARAGQATVLLITLLFGLLVLGLARRLPTFWGAAATVGLALLYAGAVYLLWSRMRLWVDLVMPLVGGLLTFTAATLDNYLREEAEKRRVRGVFNRYVSRNVVAELLRNPEMLELGGQRVELTVLFSDIRGFTYFSESRDPREVVERLNEYLGEMVAIIFRNGGTLDKYMGDGIMAYFGAPIQMPDHAERALRTAYEMRERMKELHAQWASRGVEPFKIGVGINTGEVIAGNVGHPDRMEYSLIGATVNLASRLEGLTKEYARDDYAGIVMSETTYRSAPQGVSLLQPTAVGEVDVRGMAQRVRIYSA